MSKRKVIGLIVAALLCLLAVGTLCTPKGALRFAIVRSGHPIKAVTSGIGPAEYAFAGAGQIGYTLRNPPYEAQTDSTLCNWVVTRRGAVYWGEYYGYG